MYKFAALAVALAAGAAVTLSALHADDTAAPVAGVTAPAASEPSTAAEPVTAAQPVAAAADRVAPPASTDLDIDAMMAERMLGDPNAPVRIDEYASLTCPHCAHFSKDILPNLRRDYIDTGKVKLVYHDFPLNPEAVTAAILARCAPAPKYFVLIESFFETQEDWAYKSNMVDMLKSATAMAGLPNDRADACLASEALRNAILKERIEASEKLSIDSTPTLIFNGDVATRVGGPADYEAMKALVEKALADAATKP